MVELKEIEARQKARTDWREVSEYKNNYPKGSIESLAYQAEYLKAAKECGEYGWMYE